MQSNVESRESVLKQMRDSEEVAAKLIAGLSEAQGNWQPVVGRTWSIWQCLEHLSLTNVIYTKALAEGLANAAPSARAKTVEIRPRWLGRWFLSQVGPPVRLRVKTTTKVRPAMTGELGQALVHFQESHEALRGIVKSWDAVDLNRVHYPNPFFPLVRFTVGTGLLIANAHDRRHLWQAQLVKEAPGYPKA